MSDMSETNSETSRSSREGSKGNGADARAHTPGQETRIIPSMRKSTSTATASSLSPSRTVMLNRTDNPPQTPTPHKHGDEAIGHGQRQKTPTTSSMSAQYITRPSISLSPEKLSEQRLLDITGVVADLNNIKHSSPMLKDMVVDDAQIAKKVQARIVAQQIKHKSYAPLIIPDLSRQVATTSIDDSVRFVRDKQGNFPKPRISGFAVSSTISEQQELLDHFLRWHKIIAKSHIPPTTFQRREFERDVYDFSRTIGMGKAAASIEVKKARAMALRVRGLPGAHLLDDSDAESALGIEFDASPTILKIGNKRKMGDRIDSGTEESKSKKKQKKKNPPQTHGAAAQKGVITEQNLNQIQGQSNNSKTSTSGPSEGSGEAVEDSDAVQTSSNPVVEDSKVEPEVAKDVSDSIAAPKKKRRRDKQSGATTTNTTDAIPILDNKTTTETSKLSKSAETPITAAHIPSAETTSNQNSRKRGAKKNKKSKQATVATTAGGDEVKKDQQPPLSTAEEDFVDTRVSKKKRRARKSNAQADDALEPETQAEAHENYLKSNEQAIELGQPVAGAYSGSRIVLDKEDDVMQELDFIKSKTLEDFTVTGGKGLSSADKAVMKEEVDMQKAQEAAVENGAKQKKKRLKVAAGAQVEAETKFEEAQKAVEEADVPKKRGRKAKGSDADHKKGERDQVATEEQKPKTDVQRKKEEREAEILNPDGSAKPLFEETAVQKKTSEKKRRGKNERRGSKLQKAEQEAEQKAK